ncbi:SDR family oxidoreductase [Chondromyces crocatus]|uniref:NmrA family protein n=1 Tax=Chondromyces crocatus TaxID=52 RepID=A0A0K1ENB8_CHOCO|nr:SDR family oxidoreductase [Chondromyces crocatus]AKT42127.1 NmrA family protein [Chondromyces crocatus]
MIVVFGSSGTVGRELVSHLVRAGHGPLRAVYHRHPVALYGVETVQVDVAQGRGIEDALRGARAVFLLTGDMPDQAGAELRVVEAAARAGVERLVKLSVLAAPSEAFPLARIHRAVERAIETTRIPFTFLRPGSFMQNFVLQYGHEIRAESRFSLPCGDAHDNHVDARDIARVAARCLTESGHEGRSYDLVGPEPLTYHEAAEKLSQAVGKTIAYVAISSDEFTRRMQATGAPRELAEGLLEMFRYHATSGVEQRSSAIREVTGQEPTSLAAFAREHAAAFRS